MKTCVVLVLKTEIHTKVGSQTCTYIHTQTCIFISKALISSIQPSIYIYTKPSILFFPFTFGKKTFIRVAAPQQQKLFSFIWFFSFLFPHQPFFFFLKKNSIAGKREERLLYWHDTNLFRSFQPNNITGKKV